MAPWEIAKQRHNQCCKEDFWQRLGWHLSCGYVWSAPGVFMLASEANYNESTSEVGNDGEPNCWFIELAAAVGDANAVGRLFGCLPHKREWVCWRRNNGFNIKAYRWEHLARKVG